ncbi:MAG: acyl-CoA dehydrogenase family protein [Planctomycetota bacterium]
MLKPNDELTGRTESKDDAMSLILQQAGKSASEVAALSTLDDADRTAENQFSGEAPTISSLFGTGRAREFFAGSFSPTPEVAEVMGNSLEFLMNCKEQGQLLDNDRMLFRDEVLSGLSERGFFGLAIPKEYGGSGAKLGDLGPLLRALTFIHPDLAVMFEVHNFLGPVTPILDFGTEEQKQLYLPKMAKGELLGSFALTEPGVGADPSRLSMTAKLDVDDYVISGIKWPITNVIYGGICVLVVKLEGHDLKPGRDSGMIVFEVPAADTDHFRMKRNDLTAFDYLWNARFRLMEYRVPKTCLLGPPGRGLAQAFSSLAKGRGGIGVNSAAKTFKLLAHLILDPESQSEQNSAPQSESNPGEPNGGGWTSFRSTFGKPIGSAPRIQTWIGRATAHGLAGRVLGDLCFRLAANGVRDETQGMIAKVYATKALLQTAINCYQIQGGRSVHTDELRKYSRLSHPTSSHGEMPDHPIENYIGENMHEFTIATVYEGPNPVLADVGAPNAMTRSIRGKFLEPIGMAEVAGKSGLGAKMKFGWFVTKTILGSYWPTHGDMGGVDNMFMLKRKYVEKAFKRNRVLGRRILLIIARYQKSFMDQSFLLGDEGGVFDQLCHNLASLCFALSMEKPETEYLKVAAALDEEAALRLTGKTSSPKLQQMWAEIGQLMMDKNSKLHQDLIAPIKVADIPLDPRFMDRFI